jgi:hypothetical protein
MHLGSINWPFMPHNLIPAQCSPVPLSSSRWLPDLSFNVLWVQEKGTQIRIYFFSQKFQQTNPLHFRQQGALWRELPIYKVVLHISQFPHKNFPQLKYFSLLLKDLEKEILSMFPKSGAPMKIRPFPEPYLSYPSVSSVKELSLQVPLIALPQERNPIPRSLLHSAIKVPGIRAPYSCSPL